MRNADSARRKQRDKKLDKHLAVSVADRDHNNNLLPPSLSSFSYWCRLDSKQYILLSEELLNMSLSTLMRKAARSPGIGRSFRTYNTNRDAVPWISTISLDSLLAVRPPRQGTGFDNFLGKDKKSKGGKNSNSNKNNNNNDNNGTWMAALSLLGLTYLLSRTMKTEENEATARVSPTGGSNEQHPGLDHREISWHDFLRLLQQRDVVKVLVTGNDGDERQSARVYLRSNAKGLTGTSNFTSSDAIVMNNNNAPTATSQSSSYERLRRAQQAKLSSNSEFQHEISGTEYHDSMDASMSGNGSTGSSGLASTMVQPNPGYYYYRMPIGSIESFENKLDEAQRALGRDPSQDVPVQYMADSSIARELVSVVPGVLLAAMLFGMMRFAGGGIGGAGGGRGGMGGIFQIGKSTHKKISKEDVSVNFGNVAGCDEAKKEVMEFVDFLKDSERFTKLGAKIPKGALLCGPPGTGKTLLAKAVAGEAGVPFYSISGSDFIEMFVGVGPSRVRDLFNEARQNAPCIVFIDEIDAVGRQRGRGGMGGNDERENTLNQLLVEMDGFSPSTGVVVLAGTNRVDILDQALTRPGRFDRQIMVGKPDLKGRKEIFKVHLSGIALEDNVDDISGRLAGLTPGFAGADIANICNEAAIVAARRKGETVTLEDFEKATDRIIGGLESNKIMSKEERSIVAFHEAGHAVAGWFLEHADPLLKVTIIPRSSGALGFAQYLPKEVFLRTQEQIMDIVCMTLAGRAAEEIFFGRVTTGASDDLKKVTKLVYSTIQLYGMNARLGQLSFPKDPNAMWDDRPYSEKTAKVMDEEARAVVDSAYERILALLTEKKTDVEKVANLLLSKETITHDDVLEIIGPRPFKANPAYAEFIQRKKTLRKNVEASEEEQTEEKDSQETPVDGPLHPGLA
jgi:AFG3 family protein